MLKTTCGHLGTYLGMPGDQITFTAQCAPKRAPSVSVQPEVCRDLYPQLCLLHRNTDQDGPQARLATGCFGVGRLAAPLGARTEKKITDIVRHLWKVTKSPAEVTAEISSIGIRR